MRSMLIPAAVLTACAACGQQEASENGGNAAQTANVANAVAPPLNNIEPGEPGGLPDDRNLVSEEPIDPKSAQGAGQVLQSYAALLEQGRFAEAWQHWSGGGEASGLGKEEFAVAYAKYAEIHAEIGAPGQMEGAAGSAYVDFPLRLYGRLRDGRSFNATGTATLRRVNDVPGSTPEQRQWRIYRLDMQPPV